MQRLIRSVAALVILVVVLGLGFIDADARRVAKARARCYSPRNYNPTITDETSATGEPKVLSTADETADPVENTKPRKKKAAQCWDMEETIMRSQIRSTG